VWWDNNKSMPPDSFDALHRAMMNYAQSRELFVQDLYGGADPTHRCPPRGHRTRLAFALYPAPV